MANLVGTKGQVVIEKEIRDKLGIKAGWKAFQRVVDGHIEIHFRPPASNRSLKGSLRPYIDPKLLEEAEKMDWHEIRDRAWETATDDEQQRWLGGADEQEQQS